MTKRLLLGSCALIAFGMGCAHAETTTLPVGSTITLSPGGGATVQLPGTEPPPPPIGETPLSALITTTDDGAAFEASCAGAGPNYPAQWDWDPAAILGTQPQSATEAMGLTPKIEQYRGGALVATWTQFSGNSTSCPVDGREDDPNSAASHACGGPFPINSFREAAWKAGDVFKVYPAVYKESVYLGPSQRKAESIAVTAGQTTVTVSSTAKLAVGDAVLANTFFPRITRIASINSPTSVTLDRAILTTGTASLQFLKNVDITIEGVTQNVGGVPTRPTFVWDDYLDLRAGSGKGLLMLYGGTDADIRNFVFRNIDLIVPTPPYGQRFYYTPSSPAALIYMGGTENQGATLFEDMRVMGTMNLTADGGGMGALSGDLGTYRSSSGTLTFNRVEMGFNGGSTGPAHNAYIGETFMRTIVTNSYFHDVDAGHLMKLRSVDNVIKGNYFQGKGLVPYSNYGESNDLDIPCGGALTLTDNIFARNVNYLSKNFYLLMYSEDKSCSKEFNGKFDPSADQLEKKIDIRNNTFASFTKNTQASIGYRHTPFGFYGYLISSGKYPAGTTVRPPVLPGDPGFPSADATVKNNVFVGFCPSPADRIQTFPWSTNSPKPVGPNLTTGWRDINQKFGLTTNYVPSGDTSIVGELAYAHPMQGTMRARATFGAQDASAGTAAPPSTPYVFLTADALQVASGRPVNLQWNLTGDATACTASGGWSGSKTVSSGSETITPPSDVETDYALTCTGPSGSTTAHTKVQAIGLPSVATFTEAPNPKTAGTQPVFSWTSQNADICAITGPSDNTGSANAAGHAFTAKPTTTAYWLACHGIRGWSEASKILVTVTGTTETPTVLFMPPVGGFYDISAAIPITFTWEASGATSCTGTNFSTGGATSGSVSVSPLVNTTYSISCTGPGGTGATISRAVTPTP